MKLILSTDYLKFECMFLLSWKLKSISQYFYGSIIPLTAESFFFFFFVIIYYQVYPFTTCNIQPGSGQTLEYASYKQY